jgi:hypothetical protein
VPTFEEAGVSDLVLEQWLGIFAPAHTPAAITMRLNIAHSPIPWCARASPIQRRSRLVGVPKSLPGSSRSFQSDPAGIGIASFDAMRKVVTGQIGRGSAANPSITKNVEPARPDRQCQTAPSGTKTKLPARASKAR